MTRPKWQRFLVFVAGATFNIILAFLLHVAATMRLLREERGSRTPTVYPWVVKLDEGSEAEIARGSNRATCCWRSVATAI